MSGTKFMILGTMLALNTSIYDAAGNDGILVYIMGFTGLVFLLVGWLSKD